MKILDVTEFYSERGGGVRSHLSIKSHVLCQLGHEHIVVAPGPPAPQEERPLGTPDPDAGRLARGSGGARLIRVGGPASPYDPSYHLLVRFDKIAAVVARERPDVLEIHSPYLAAAGALRVDRAHFGIRTFQWHSDFIDTYAGVARGAASAAVARASLPSLASGLADRATAAALHGASRPLWALVRAITSRCDATLVAARWQADKLAAHGVDNVVRVPFGVERSIFRPDARSFEGRRELLAMLSHDVHDDDVQILVGLGRFAVEKRWDVVLDAFLELRERRARRVVLVLFGDGPERERMMARVRGSRADGDVVFPGFVRDREALARHLASADALVHGCPFETFGLSIAEAMSTGLPVVVPDEGGAAEMHEEGAGETYRALDPRACADATARLLDRLAQDPDVVRARTLAIAGRLPTIREQFEGQIACYEELLQARQRSLGSA